MQTQQCAPSPTPVQVIKALTPPLPVLSRAVMRWVSAHLSSLRATSTSALPQLLGLGGKR